jgi:hypothetical protein
MIHTNAMLAAISLAALVNLFIYIVVAGLIFWLFWWLTTFLPEPFAKVARVILAILAVLFLVNLLLGLVGTPIFQLTA